MDNITQFDGNFLIGIQQLLHADWLTPVMKAITMFGEVGIFWILVCLALMISKRTRRLGIICSISLAFAFLCCNLIIKPAVSRTRPWVLFEEVVRLIPDPGDPSFPSGHVTNSIAPAWAMFLTTVPGRIINGEGRVTGRSYDCLRCLGWKGEGADPRTVHKFSIAAVILSVLIGVSRLYLGVHFPTDVLGGFIVGMLAATIVYNVILRIEDKRGVIGSVRSEEADGAAE
ncbi:MAG: phosphatase PAP2 family protein [Mogibacterium sp.]|nr:phosphatase PAP2 family protein [Mogibacterium sp.]